MINGKTEFLGLLGNPVKHSVSPVMQNAALKEMNLNWCYIALPCRSEDLESVLKSLRTLNFHGLNVTIPHKNIITNLCTELTPLAKRLGAVNTLLPNTNQGWTGGNTDVEGFLAPLKSKNYEWENRSAMVLGCGGSAKAVVTGLKELGIDKINVIGRDKDRLNIFINNLNQTLFDFPKKSKEVSIKGCLATDSELSKSFEKIDLFVNATPIGMTNEKTLIKTTDNIPLGKEIWQKLDSEAILYDLVYTPRPTEWLKLGKKQGYECIDGLEMLVQQGAASLKLWSDKQFIPIDIMRKAAKNALLD